MLFEAVSIACAYVYPASRYSPCEYLFVNVTCSEWEIELDALFSKSPWPRYGKHGPPLPIPPSEGGQFMVKGRAACSHPEKSPLKNPPVALMHGTLSAGIG